MSAAFSAPAWAVTGDVQQSQEDQYIRQTQPNGALVMPTPAWNGQRTYRDSTRVLPGSAITSPGMYDSAAEESHITGKVDASEAAPPQTGADVQPGDMGPSNAKGQ